MAQDEESPLPGDWAVEFLDKLANSRDTEATEALYRATMAAGPDVIPQLGEALKDDRTAEFAAQALAYIGGEKAMQMLWKLVADPRDLGLRRFYYGALGEFDSPQATETLLDAIRRADQEPDRTVTEAAILALTVRSDAKLLEPPREAHDKIKDEVIRLDLENAMDVIGQRAKYLAAPGRKPGGSIEQAVRVYFAPALEAAAPPDIAPAAPRPPASRRPPAKPVTRSTPPKPLVDLHILNTTLSPNQTRALARVSFEDPSATAYYDIVLQKQYGDWTVSSVWLGSEVEKQPVKPAPAESEEN
ncbi:MAG: HEAT repeat domain-containing protein [Acidobacteriia bacterium]|nr:HEAT repeat domain-containing protein [Terriglobia bacterium]